MTPKPTTPSFPISFHRVSGAALLAGVSLLAASTAAALEPAELQQILKADAEVVAIGGAIASWAGEQVPSQGIPPATIDVTTVPVISHAALVAILVPDHIDAVPELDPWGNPYEFRLDPGWSGSGSFGGVRSAGADGVFDGDVYAYGRTVTPADDLLRWDGERVRLPGAPFLSPVEAQARTAQDITMVTEAIIGWVWGQPLPLPLQPDPTDGETVDLGLYQPITVAELRDVLAPYFPMAPEIDPWGHPYDFYLDPEPPFEVPLMAVRSRGRDGIAEGDVYTIGTFPATDFHRDTVVADVAVVQYPDTDFFELLFVGDFETGDARFWTAWSP
jgi:hypothetical protein